MGLRSWLRRALAMDEISRRQSASCDYRDALLPDLRVMRLEERRVLNATAVVGPTVSDPSALAPPSPPQPVAQSAQSPVDTSLDGVDAGSAAGNPGQTLQEAIVQTNSHGPNESHSIAAIDPGKFLVSDSAFAAAAANGTPGITLQAVNDGQADMLHAYFTGTTIDAVAPQQLSEITDIIVTGRADADDILSLDFSNGINPIPAGLSLTFDGLGQATAIGDGMSLIGGAFDSVSYAAGGSTIDGRSGSITLVDASGARTIHYDGLEPIVQNVAVLDLVFNLTTAQDAAVLKAGPSAGTMTLESTNNTFESVTFLNPLAGGSLTINSPAPVAGTDTIEVRSLGTGFNAALTIHGNSSDTLQFTNSINTGSGSLLAEAGLIQISAGITTGSGNQTYDGDVVLKANTTLSGANVTLAKKVDADAAANFRTLNVNSGGTTTFGGSVGGTQALLILITDAPGTTRLNGSDVKGTVVDFKDDVVLTANVTVTASVAAFEKTINADAAANNRTLTVNAGSQKSFLGNIGNTQPLLSLTTDALGSTLLSSSTVTVGSLDLRSDVLLGANVSINATTLTFQKTLNSDTAGTPRDLSVSATGGDVAFQGVVGTTALGAVNIADARHVTINRAFTAASLKQATGSGTTTVGASASVHTAAAAGIDLTNQAISIQGPLTADGTGPVKLKSTLGDVTVAGAIGTAGGSARVDAKQDALLQAAITTVGGGVAITAGRDITGNAAGTMTTTAAANSGVVSGSATITAGRNVSLAGTVRTAGANNASGAGSAGGTVQVTATNGSVAVADISSGGGTGTAAAGGSAGSIALSALGSAHDITLNGLLNATGGNGTPAGVDGATTLTAGGTIIDGNGAAPNVRSGSLAATAAAGIGTAANPLEIQVATLDAQNSTSGSIVLAEADDVIVNRLAQSGGGDVILTAGGSIVVVAGQSGVTATTGTIRLSAAANLTVNKQVSAGGAGSNVDLASGGQIALADNVSAVSRITLQAAAGVSQTAGTVTSQALLLLGGGLFDLQQAGNNVVVLAADLTGGGSLSYHDTDGVQVGTVVGTAGSVSGIQTHNLAAAPAHTGNVRITAGGLIDVQQAINTSAGTGGVITVQGNVTVNAALVAGAGDIFLQGPNAGTGTIVIDVDLISSTPITLEADVDIIIKALVKTTTAGADIIIRADKDADGKGGVWVQAAGKVDSAGKLSVFGSELMAVPATSESVLVDADSVPAADQLLAAGDIQIAPNAAAPATADMTLSGVIHNTNGSIDVLANHQILLGTTVRAESGDIAFRSDVLLTAGSTVQTDAAATTIAFEKKVDSDSAGTPRDLTISATGGDVTFQGVVGTTALGAVNITDARDVNIDQSFTATSLKQTTGSGTTTVGGSASLHTTAAAGIDLTNQTISVQGPLTADGAGPVKLKSTLGGIDLNGSIDTFATSFATPSGDVTLDAKTTLALSAAGDITTRGGAVSLTSGGAMTFDPGAVVNADAANAARAGGTISVTANSGDLALGQLITDSSVSVSAPAGQITDLAASNDNVANIIADSATLTSLSGIGQGSGGSLDLNVRTLTSAQVSGDGGIQINLFSTADANHGLAADHNVLASLIQTGGAGGIVLTGTSGGGTRTFAQVTAANGPVNISADHGNITVQNVSTVAAAGQTIDIAVVEADKLFTHASGTIQSNGGAITVKSDNMSLVAGSAIASGAADVRLRPFDNAQNIAIGIGATDSASTLGLTDVELKTITTAATNTIIVGEKSGAAATDLTRTISIVGAADLGSRNLSLETANDTTSAINDGTPGAGGNRITGGNLTFLAAGGIDASTDAGLLAAQSTGAASLRAIRVDELNAVNVGSFHNVTGLQTANGPITLIAGGTITLTEAIAAGQGGTVDVESTGGQINDATDDDIADVSTSGAATLKAATGIGVSGGSLDVNIRTLTLAQSNTGGVNINLLGTAGAGMAADHPVDVTKIDAVVSGNISLTGTAGAGQRTYTLLDTNAGQIDVSTAQGDMALGLLTAGTGGVPNTVAVTTGSGAITDNNGASLNIVGSTATLKAVTGIGAADALEVTVASISAESTGAGDVRIKSLAKQAVTATSLKAGTGDIQFVQTGVVTGQTLAVNLATTTSGAIDISNAGATLTVGQLTAGGGQNATLTTTAGGDVLVDNVSAVGGTARITSAGAIEESTIDLGVDVTAAVIDLSAVTGIGVIDPLELSTAALTAKTVNGGLRLNNLAIAPVTVSSLTTGTGQLALHQTGGQSLLVSLATTGNGAITIDNSGADLTVVQATAGGAHDLSLATIGAGSLFIDQLKAAGGLARLTAAGAIDEMGAGDAGIDITAVSAALRAGTGIGGGPGGPIEISVSQLAAENLLSGDILLDNSGPDLIVGPVDGLPGVQLAGTGPSTGQIALTNLGALTVNGPVSNSSGGDIHLTTFNGGALTVNAPLAASGGDGSIVMQGAGGLFINDSGQPVDISVVNNGNIIGNPGGIVTIGSDVLIQSGTGAITRQPPLLANVVSPQLLASGFSSVFGDFGAPGERNFTITVNWADQTIESFNFGSSSSFLFGHFYTANPNVLNPSAPIPITLTLDNDPHINIGVTQTIIVTLARVPGDGVTNRRIDTSPKVTFLGFPAAGVIVYVAQTSTNTSFSSTVVTTTREVSVQVEGETRRVVLRVVGEDGSEEDFEFPTEDNKQADELLAQFPGWFIEHHVPDGRYKVLLKVGEELRLVMDVEVREGLPRDPSQQESEGGTQDKPPTSQAADPAGEELEDETSNDASNEEQTEDESPPAAQETFFGQERQPASAAMLPGAALLGGAIVRAARGRWEERVEGALAKSGDGSLSKAARLARRVRNGTIRRKPR